MHELIAAQIIGTVGYLICILSANFKEKRTILYVDCLGLVLIAWHWYLFDLPMATCANFISLYASFFAALSVSRPKAIYAQSICFPMILLCAYLSYQDTIPYYLFVVGSVSISLGKLSKDIKKLRIMSMVASALWFFSGLIVYSIPAASFAAFYFISHAYHLGIWQKLQKHLPLQQRHNYAHAPIRIYPKTDINQKTRH